MALKFLAGTGLDWKKNMYGKEIISVPHCVINTIICGGGKYKNENESEHNKNINIAKTIKLERKEEKKNYMVGRWTSQCFNLSQYVLT